MLLKLPIILSSFLHQNYEMMLLNMHSLFQIAVLEVQNKYQDTVYSNRAVT